MNGIKTHSQKKKSSIKQYIQKLLYAHQQNNTVFVGDIRMVLT